MTSCAPMIPMYRSISWVPWRRGHAASGTVRLSLPLCSGRARSTGSWSRTRAAARCANGTCGSVCSSMTAARSTWICGTIAELLLVAAVVPVGDPGLGVVDTAAALAGVGPAVDAGQGAELVATHRVEPLAGSTGGHDQGLARDTKCGHRDVSMS